MCPSRYHADVIRPLRARYNVVVVQTAHYGLILSIMLVNALIATSYVQIYYRCEAVQSRC